MLAINAHERQHNVPTPKHTGGLTGTPKARVPRAKNAHFLNQLLQVAHQRVNLEVDLPSKSLYGYTELTVVPLAANLRVIRLDAREMKIKRILVNGSQVTNYIHRDLLYINDPQLFEDSAKSGKPDIWDLYSSEFTINQHHLLKEKLNYLFGEVGEESPISEKLENLNTEELAILLPDNLKLELTDLNAIHTPNSLAPATSLTPLQLRVRNTVSEVYTPIQIGIEYEIINPKSGVNFACDPEVERKFWHAYTVNSEFNVSASSWVPCIDNMIEKSTWSIELSIPRTIKDIGNSLAPTAQNGVHDSDDTEAQKWDSKQEADGEEDEDEDGDNLDLIVCTGDFNNTKETPHHSNISKKVVSWSIFNPVSAHHIGWAFGAFESTELTATDDGAAPAAESDEGAEEFEEIEKDASSSSVMLYYLPGQEELVKNTCIFAQEALEHILKEYGSFPFSTYAITFVEGPRFPYNNFAGLSLISTEVLYPPEVIEPMFSVTEDILECIAAQWSGINIVPQGYNDIWCTIGIAKFMTFLFMNLLVGSNEFRYQIKQKMDKIVDLDINRRPIGHLSFQTPLSESDLLFIRLKSPIILFILDRRMTKTDKSFGLSRVLPKLFLQAMSGDLQNGALSTLHFQYVCEKVNRNRLELFFRQWVWGTGTPIFNITQKFNKKRSMIEVAIRQSQSQQAKQPQPSPETFVKDATNLLNNDQTFPTPLAFVGPMTIRVHEADGTPYEHIVDIKDSVVKFDVQYNTKFKRLKKNKDEFSEGNPVFSKLGDILLSESDIDEWNFDEWPKRDEDFFDPFEWIRVDTDFEWIATVNVIQPDYMFGSQLQQDRDIEAQIQAIRYFGNQEKSNQIYCTMLTRTLMDKRYFYGVRIAAAKALAEVSNSANSFIGLEYLLKAFTQLFCFKHSYIPIGNSFDDFGEFFIQKAIPKFLAHIKDDEGNTPAIVKSLLFNLLKYNDNSNNDFQDCFYVADLVEALVHAVIPTGQEQRTVDFHMERELAKLLSSNEQRFLGKVLEEIERIQKLDRWVSSYQSVVSYACIEQKIVLARNNLFDLSFENLLYYTRKRYTQKIRLLAFKGLFLLGGLKNTEILKYFLKVCLLEDCSAEFRFKMIQILINSISDAAVRGTPSMLDDPEFKSLEKILDSYGTLGKQSNMVVIEEARSSEMDTRRDTLARESVKGALALLRRDLSVGRGLKMTLREMLHTSLLSLHEKKLVFMICDILYTPVDSYLVRIPVPCVPFEELKKKIVAKNIGEGKVIIKREGRFKILLSTKILLTSTKAEAPSRREGSRSNTRSSRTHVEEIPDEPQPIPKPKPPPVIPEEAKPKIDPAPTKRKARLVTRDLNNSLKLKIKFNNHKLKPLTEKTSTKSSVLVENTQVKIKFQNPKSKSQLSAIVGPTHKYIKINYKKRKVAVSDSRFEETSSISLLVPTNENMEEEEELPKKNGDQHIKEEDDLTKVPERTDSRNETKQSDESEDHQTNTETKKIDTSHGQKEDTPIESEQKASSVSRASLEATKEDRSRAASPFASDDSASKTKRKKTKIYIHGNTSKLPSPVSTPEASASPQNQESEKPAAKAPKLKLKLSLRK